jgi:hypothetical protein
MSERECILLHEQTKIDDEDVFPWYSVPNGMCFILHRSIEDCRWSSQSLKWPMREFCLALNHVWGRCSQRGSS